MIIRKLIAAVFAVAFSFLSFTASARTFSYIASGGSIGTGSVGVNKFYFNVGAIKNIKSATVSISAVSITFGEASVRFDDYLLGGLLGAKGGDDFFEMSISEFNVPLTLIRPAHRNLLEVEVAPSGYGQVARIMASPTLVIEADEAVLVETSYGKYKDRVTLQWMGGSSYATYTIRRNGTVIASGVSGSSYDDFTAEPGKVYTYEIISSNGVSGTIEGYRLPEAPTLGDLTFGEVPSVKVIGLDRAAYTLASVKLVGSPFPGEWALKQELTEAHLEPDGDDMSITFTDSVRTGSVYCGAYSWWVEAVFTDITGESHTVKTSPEKRIGTDSDVSVPETSVSLMATGSTAEALTVDLSLALEEPGEYDVVGVLADANGKDFLAAVTPITVAKAGSKTCRVSFPGSDIYTSGSVGPYTLSSVAVYRDGELLSIKRPLSQVSDKSFEFFRPSGSVITIPRDSLSVEYVGDYGETLRFSFDVDNESAETRSADISFDLCDSTYESIDYFSGRIDFEPGRHGYYIDYDVLSILESDAVAPYYFSGIEISDPAADCKLFFRIGSALSVPAPEMKDGLFPASLSVESDVVCEGSEIVLTVSGGRVGAPSSATIFVNYLTAAVADLNLAKATIDGETPKAGVKFPLTISWAADDVSKHVLRIPVKVDATLEGPESLAFSLSSSTLRAQEDVRATVTLDDATIPSGITLPFAANAPLLKVSSSGAAKWTPVPDGYICDANGYIYQASGMYNLRTPELARGKSSSLTFSGMKGLGSFVMFFHFEGEEEEDSILSIKYDGKYKAAAYQHRSIGNKWYEYEFTFLGSSAHTITLDFTKGSDLPADIRVIAAYWVPRGKPAPILVDARAESDSEFVGGYVTGLGFYQKGETAKLKAVAYPGFEFLGWYEPFDDAKPYSNSATLSIKVAKQMSLRARFKPYSLVSALPIPANGGKITGCGYLQNGKPVTMKATPEKGFVFAGWYKDASFTQPFVSDGEYRNPSLAVKSAEESLSLFARFEPIATDVSIDLTVGNQNGYYRLLDYPEGLTFATDGSVTLYLLMKSVSLPKATVTGLPPGVKFDAKTNLISGKATKPGYYSIVVKMTSTNVKKPIEAKFALKVDNLTEANALLVGSDNPETALQNARGRTYKIMVGVPASSFLPTLLAKSPTAKIAVSGLPAGLKYDAKTGQITGVATKDGNFTVSVTVTEGKTKSVSTFTIDVHPLPEWAVGSFAGVVRQGEKSFDATVTASVAATGKITFKLVSADKKTTISASSASFTRMVDEKLILETTAKVQSRVVALELGLMGAEIEEGGDRLIGVMTVDVEEVNPVNPENALDFSSEEDSVLQSLWVRKDVADLPVLAGCRVTLECGGEIYTLTFAKNGSATDTLVSAANPKVILKKGAAIVNLYGREAGVWYADVYGSVGCLALEIHPDGRIVLIPPVS